MNVHNSSSQRFMNHSVMSAFPNSDTTLPTSVKRAKYSTIWLDLLPVEVCSRIAAFLPPNRPNDETFAQPIPDVLALAQASPVQNLAIASMQTYISIEHTNSVTQTNTLVQSWKDLIPQVRELHLPKDTTNNAEVIELLSRPAIKKAVIPNYPSLLNALYNGRSVRELEVRVTTYCPENGEQGLSTSLPKVLRLCPVEKLRIICEGCTGCPTNSCIVNRILQPLRRAKKRSQLRSLYIKCSSVKMAPLPRLASFFPNLVHFGLDHWLPVDHLFLEQPVDLALSDESFNVLLHIRRLEMINCGSIDTFVPDALLPNVGQNLVSFSSVEALTAADVRKLDLCVNLERLSIALEAGAEESFPESIQKLQSISITWNPKYQPQLCQEYYSTLDSEFLTRIAQRNPQLCEIRLRNVSIPSAVLEALLARTSKLRVLHVPIFHQPEPAPHRFSHLVKLVIRHCRVLEELEVCAAPFRRVALLPALRSHDRGFCDPNSCSLCELRGVVDTALRVLRRRCGQFREDGLKRLAFHLTP